MKSLFNIDSPFMAFLSRIADLIILNLLTILCCIPIVTIGASITSMYYVANRLLKDETRFVTKDFFHSFKMNFCQASLLSLIYLVVVLALGVEYYWIYVVKLQSIVNLKYLVFAATAFVVLALPWSFILLSRYQNRAGRILINSLCLVFTELPKSLLIAVLAAAPIILTILWMPFTPVALLLGFSLSGYLQAFLFSKVFKKMEHC